MCLWVEEHNNMQDCSCAPVLSQLHTAHTPSSLDPQRSRTLSGVSQRRADCGHSNRIDPGTALVAAQLAHAYPFVSGLYIDVRRHMASGRKPTTTVCWLDMSNKQSTKTNMKQTRRDTSAFPYRPRAPCNATTPCGLAWLPTCLSEDPSL